MVFLLLEDLRGNEHGEVAVLDTEGFDARIEPFLNRIPDSVGPWSEDVASADAVVVDHFAFDDHLGSEPDISPGSLIGAAAQSSCHKVETSTECSGMAERGGRT